MRNLRIIPRLDIKQKWLIKGVQMEGWRKVGDPAEAAQLYASQGADELILMDVVASLYDRNNLHDIIKKVAASVFIPITVGGGIRKLDDVSTLLESGADKVSINTAATKDPSLITQISEKFGSQATVVSIEAVRSGNNSWEAMIDNGRNHTYRDAIEWAKEAEQRGAGEIVVTSIDQDGLGNGYEIELIQKISSSVTIPVVASGGLGTPEHLGDLLDNTNVSAAASAQALHWKKLTVTDLRNVLPTKGCYLRPLYEGSVTDTLDTIEGAP